MKRFALGLVTTVVGLYLTLSYRMPVTLATASNAVAPTEMTLPPDSQTGDTGLPDTTTTTALTGPDATTTTTLPVAPGDTTTTVAPSGPTPTTPTTRATPGAITTTTAAPKNTPTTARPVTTTVVVTAPSTTSTTVAAKRTVNGSTISTKYGPVQVAITVQGTKIVGVSALQHPTGGASDSINASAVPTLQQETLQAQSANVATVSGATYTSDGWRQSLQAALSSAGLA